MFSEQSPQVMAAEIIKATREGAGITLRSLAKQVGISHTHLARIESGERPLTPDLAAKIATAIAATPRHAA